MTRLVRLAFTLLSLVVESGRRTAVYASLVAACHENDALLEPFVAAVRHGHFSRARWLAHTILQSNPTCQRSLSQIFVDAAVLAQQNDDDEKHCTTRLFQDAPAAATSNDDYEHPRLIAVQDADDCWAYQITEASSWLPPDLWSRCCSQLPQEDDKNQKKKEPSPNLFGAVSALPGANNDDDNDDECFNNARQRLCCDFVQGSSSYLHLPLLHEPAIRLRVQQTDDQRTGQLTKSYNLQQDGFLRPYDPSGILWPTAYLLSLCVAAPKRCGIPEIYQAVDVMHGSGKNKPIAIELGAGLGAPSIVLADTLQRHLSAQRYTNSTTTNKNTNHQPLVLATDASYAALALAYDNARTARASVAVQALDFFNQTSIQQVAAAATNNDGFAIVLGSSLMALFDESNPQPLWQVLNALLSRHDNPHAVAILAHSVHALPEEAGQGLRLVRRISGIEFHMFTRHNAQASDFEISVYARRPEGLAEEY